MNHDQLCPVSSTEAEIYWRSRCPYCTLIARVRADEGERYDGMTVVHWDAGHSYGLWDAEVTSRKQSFSQGLWVGWAIGTLMLLIPIIFLAVTR